MEAFRQVLFLTVTITCGMSLDINQEYIDKISSLDIDNMKEADWKKLADDILGAPLGEDDLKMLDPLMMDNPEMHHDLKKLEEQGPRVKPLDKPKLDMAPAIIPLNSDTRRADAASLALESEKSDNELPQPNYSPTNLNVSPLPQSSYDQTAYQGSNFPQYPQANYDPTNFRRSDTGNQQSQDPARPCCLPYSYDNPYLKQFLQPPQPFIVPLKIFYEKVKHDHPPLHEIKNIIKQDKKDLRDYIKGKHRSEESRERYTSSDDSSSSSDYTGSSSAIDYYDDVLHFEG